MRLPTVLFLCFSVAASAHIKLTSPTARHVTNQLGDPQKNEPCGPAGNGGTPTNAVLTVDAGSMLTVQWTETIYHPGHFRIAIAEQTSALVTPTPVLNAMRTDCLSAPYETNPVAPVIADGLFRTHSGGAHSTQIRVPDISCERCVLQVMQFMSSHAPPCFYYQCATLRIVKPEAPSDAGTDDAGAGGSGGGGGGQGGEGGQGGGDANADAGDAVADDAGSLGGVEPAPTGCGCQPGLGLPAVLALLWLGVARRNSRVHNKGTGVQLV